MALKQPLLAARERAGLSIDEMAFLVGARSDELAAVERGEVYPAPALVERHATALGLSVRELLAGTEPTAVAFLFRRMSRESDSDSFVEAVDAGLVEALGSFVRAARDIGGLRSALGEGPRADQLSWLERFKPAPLIPRAERRQEFYEQVAELASSARKFLELDDTGEIVSMVRLVEDLGIITRFVDPHQHELDPRIDGASLLDPYPAILVNLLGGGEKWWHTRMTLAHELCHLFFDRAELNPLHPRRFFVFSPHSPQRTSGRRRMSWRLFPHFEDLEARANAFAGEFLAPTKGVRRLIRPHEATSQAAVERLCDVFKIGRETAINRLTNSFALSEEQRQQMLARPLQREGRVPVNHPDSIATGAESLHDEYFVDLVMRALAGSKIDTIQARALLNLRLSDSLPNHAAVPQELCAPLRAREEPARRAAEGHLSHNFGLEYFIESVEPANEGWRALVHRREPDGTSIMVGSLILGPDLSIRDDSSLMSSTA